VSDTVLASRPRSALGWLLLACTLSSCGDDDASSSRGDSGTAQPDGAQPDAARPDAAQPGLDDFADAEPVELVHAFLYRDFPSDMGAAPAGVEDGDVRLALRQDLGHVLYVAELGCGDPYAALLERQGDVARLLIRFTGPGHNACGSALYAMRAVLPNADASTRVMVYRQDDVAGPIELVGSALADGDDADCASLTECGADQACDLEGASSEILGPVDGPGDTAGCTALPVCGKNVCAWRREACMMTCGVPDCAIAESFPVQVVCND